MDCGKDKSLFQETVILCGSGPSIKQWVGFINESNYPVFAINNVVKLVKPDIWLGQDVILKDKFPLWIWDCPTTIKFVPTIKSDPVTFRGSKDATHIFNMKRRFYLDMKFDFNLDTFFQGRYQLGNKIMDNRIIKLNGVNVQSCSTSFLPALRVCYEMGYQRIVLAGVDLTVENGLYVHTDKQYSKPIMDMETKRLAFLKAAIAELTPMLAQRNVGIISINDLTGDR